MSMRLHHIGIAVEDASRAVDLWADVANYKVLAKVEDTQRQALIWVLWRRDEPMLEILQPTADSSPVATMLRRDMATYHTCYVVPSLDEAIKRWQHAGAKTVSLPAPAIAFNNRRVAFLMLPTKQLVELLE